MFKYLSAKEQILKERSKNELYRARQNDIETAASIAFVKLTEDGTIDRVTAAEHIDMFASWQPNVNYAVNTLASYDGVLYKCVQTHTSQEDWRPGAVPALWTKLGDPSEEFPEWSPPVGAHDAYPIGAKVSYNGRHWISTADNNVWQPGVYGWEVTE